MEKRYDLTECIEKLKNLSDYGQQEVCIFIDFMEHYEKEKGIDDDH